MKPLLLNGLDEYCRQHSTDQPELLAELERQTREAMPDAQMLSGPVEGRLLSLLVALSGARRILEVGTFTGYSALWMAMAMPCEGTLYTIDRDERALAMARRFFREAGLDDRIRICQEDAGTCLESLPGPWDMVFLDADKEHYPDYYAAIKPKLRPGGLLVVDNCLWSGQVLEPASESAAAIHRLNEILTGDPDMDNMLLSVRDGIQVARKKLAPSQ